MLKLLLKIIFIIILLFGFSNYANYLVTGEPPEINIKKLTLPNIEISKITDSISEKLESAREEIEPAAKNTYLYKWRDEKGIIHYTSEKPSENIQNIESIKLSNDTNVVPAVSENKTNSEKANQLQTPSTDLSENIYSPEGIIHLFDQAKDVQNLMNEQFSQQENIINSD